MIKNYKTIAGFKQTADKLNVYPEQNKSKIL